MNEVYLSLGSNLGKRQENLAAASRELQNLLGTPLKQSSVYETAAWGNTDQSDFLNQVLVFHLEKGREHLLLERINRSEEHTSEPQSLLRSSSAVNCLNKRPMILNKNTQHKSTNREQ